MLIKDILKLVSTIDNKKLPDDIEKMLKRVIWSESKETYIEIGEMHLDHYLRSVTKKLNIDPSSEELIEKLQGMKFLIVRWSGDQTPPSSNLVDDPLTFFNKNYYGDDVIKDLADLTVGEKYNVDEMMQDIEILRYE
jgi:hypothetical protein|tara:strand:- start:1378 stop:1788 length:411 start_codon:yes stop_codon:yes gene_type:complete